MSAMVPATIPGIGSVAVDSVPASDWYGILLRTQSHVIEEDFYQILCLSISQEEFDIFSFYASFFPPLFLQKDEEEDHVDYVPVSMRGMNKLKS